MSGLELVSELDEAGIVPDNGALQEITDIRAVIFNHIGVKQQFLYIQRPNQNGFLLIQIKEVRVYYDKTFNTINCTHSD